MRRKLFSTISFICMAVLLGGHWGILQSIAWLEMGIKYSQSMPLSKALVKTFDGKNPCGLCLAVEKGKQSERENARGIATYKIEGLLPINQMLLFPPRTFQILPSSICWLSTRSESPPIPPPRVS